MILKYILNDIDRLNCSSWHCKTVSKQKYSRCKKGVAKYENGFVEEGMKSNELLMTLFLIGIKVLVMVISLQNIVISRVQGLLMLMGSKNFYTDDQATKHCSFCIMCCGLVILIKRFDPINIRRPWAPEIAMLYIEVIMSKTFCTYQKQGPWQPIWFYIFFNKAF